MKFAYQRDTLTGRTATVAPPAFSREAKVLRRPFIHSPVLTAPAITHPFATAPIVLELHHLLLQHNQRTAFEISGSSGIMGRLNSVYKFTTGQWDRVM